MFKLPLKKIPGGPLLLIALLTGLLAAAGVYWAFAGVYQPVEVVVAARNVEPLKQIGPADVKVITKLEVDYRQYKARIDEQAQAALQMIASLYDTTGDLVRAIEGAANCTPSPMREELIKTLVEYRLGGSLPDALASFAERADNRDIDIFIKAVTLSEKYGTNTAEVVAEIARVIRDRITLREELKSEVRGQGLTINLFLLFLPLTALSLLYFSSEARHVIIATFFGKAVMCFIILVEFLAWYFTRGMGVVEEL
ncbi:type II secretion system F family protein [Moorella sulfitireducens]|uniref:type II secretion system F family protein n=1 Tax=Neomoorella sulfitireducens TaxID=2972948 RepID=UPI0021AC06E7|nr:type II secretion system F family protein [Moorella sulfitireducens]